MRITGGTARNRRLKAPGSGKKDSIRPTGDRVREALFSILGDKVAGARILDLFAGTGSLGLEALSRGAASAVFVDSRPEALDLIRLNLKACFKDANVEIIRMNLARPAAFSTLIKKVSSKNGLFDLIFLDPPYEKKLAESTLTVVEKTGLLIPNGYAIAEERANVSLPERFNNLLLEQQRRYGDTGIWIYREGKTGQL